MCLGVPGRIVEMDAHGGWAIIEAMGVHNKVYTYLVNEPLDVGDYVMVHAGCAIGRMEPDEADATLSLLREISASMEAEEEEEEG